MKKDKIIATVILLSIMYITLYVMSAIINDELSKTVISIIFIINFVLFAISTMLVGKVNWRRK